MRKNIKQVFVQYGSAFFHYGILTRFVDVDNGIVAIGYKYFFCNSIGYYIQPLLHVVLLLLQCGLVIYILHNNGKQVFTFSLYVFKSSFYLPYGAPYNQPENHLMFLFLLQALVQRFCKPLFIFRMNKIGKQLLGKFNKIGFIT